MEHYTSDESDGEPDWEPNTSYNIHDAARCADVPALQIFLAEGDSPDVLSDNPDWRNQRTPLHQLCMYSSNSMHGSNSESDRVACFELLRDAGANLEARTGRHPQGSTVVHYAADSGSPGVLSLLLQAGVDLNVVNSSNYTPLHWAARGDFRRATECVELLLKAGAAVNVRTEGGYTPFDIALTKGHRRAYPLFLRAGAEFPDQKLSHHQNFSDPYILRVKNAGGFKKYAQNHLARMTKLFADNGRGLPPEVVRQIMKFWLHAGYY